MTAYELYGELRKIINRYGNVEVTVVRDRFFVIELFCKLQSVRGRAGPGRRVLYRP